MTREYYLCGCRLDEKDYYFIWFSDDENGVYLSPEGSLVVSHDLKKIITYATRQKLPVKDEEPVFFDLEKLEETLGNKSFKVDCVEFLNAWILFDDISCAIEGNFDSDRKATKKIYEKLFWGNNLLLVTAEGKSYEPTWSKKELEIIREVLLDGMAIFRGNLKYID